jgi:hypothetical protein
MKTRLSGPLLTRESIKKTSYYNDMRLRSSLASFVPGGYLKGITSPVSMCIRCIFSSPFRKTFAFIYRSRMFHTVSKEVVLSGIVHYVLISMTGPETETSYVKTTGPAPYLDRRVLCHFKQTRKMVMVSGKKDGPTCFVSEQVQKHTKFFSVKIYHAGLVSSFMSSTRSLYVLSMPDEDAVWLSAGRETWPKGCQKCEGSCPCRPKEED